MTREDLGKIERSAYRTAMDTGLWDIFLASVFAVFAVAPFLSTRLGDFWSTAVFLPVWLLVYLGIRSVHARVILPRVGTIEVGRKRRARLRGFTWTMLALNVAALAIGAHAAVATSAGSGAMVHLRFSLVLLVGFSVAAYFLEIPRLFFYGVLLAAAPFVGEELFRRGHASHHGFPITFGAASVVIFVSGLVRLHRLLARAATHTEAAPGGRADV